MLYYRDKKSWKRLAVNTLKGVVLVGAAAWLGVSLGTAPEERSGADVVQAQAVLPAEGNEESVKAAPPSSGTSVEMAGVTAEAEREELPVAGPPVPEPVDPTAANGSFTEPAQGVLTSGYGARWGRTHTGIDIGGDDGSDILAADGGLITLAGWVSGYGNYVVIDHENGYQTAYGHCSELLVAEGERVAQGQRIARMGSTGNSTGPHLHFEVKVDGEYQNPLDYVLY